MSGDNLRLNNVVNDLSAGESDPTNLRSGILGINDAFLDEEERDYHFDLKAIHEQLYQTMTSGPDRSSKILQYSAGSSALTSKKLDGQEETRSAAESQRLPGLFNVDVEDTNMGSGASPTMVIADSEDQGTNNTMIRDSGTNITVGSSNAFDSDTKSAQDVTATDNSLHSIKVRPGSSNTLQKVISKTRPTFLPPKSRVEDRKHMADWENMMKRSRATESQKMKMKMERRRAREEAVERSIETWEKDVLPDWKKAIRDTRIRKLWWNGIPPKLRPQLWEWSVGNALALSKDTYRTCLARSRRLVSSGSFSSKFLNLIEVDIKSTLPNLRIFDTDTGPLYQDLKDLLCAWVVARSDEGLDYVVGASKVAAMFLLNMPPSTAFIAMRNLLERHCMRSFYGGLAAKEDVEAYYRIFDTLLADIMPKVYFNFKQHQISPGFYLPDWFLSLFLEHLSLETCARVWDVLLLEGDSFLYRVALSILAALEPRLFFPERAELLSLLKGQNKAALELAKRDGLVSTDGKYEIYGLDEDVLWSRLEEMDCWWKESTWTRLIQRELPDI